MVCSHTWHRGHLIMNNIGARLLTETSYFTGKYFLPPEFLIFNITFQCNFQCKMCSVWEKTCSDELKKDKWLEIIKDLKNILTKKTYILINGGEPLIRKDLIPMLITELKKYFNHVALNSNGSLLDKATINELEISGLDIIKISFYSLKKDAHNFLRGNSQAHVSALNALKLLCTSRINVEVGILVTSSNIKELPELIEYLYQLRNIAIVLQPLDERIGSQESKDMQANNLLYDFWPDSKDIHVFFKWAINNNKLIKNTAGNIKAMEEYYLHPEHVLKYRCFSGQRNLIIYPNGDVHLCFKSARIGNLMENSIEQIITSEDTVVRRRDIKNCKKYCRVCGSNFYKALKS